MGKSLLSAAREDQSQKDGMELCCWVSAPSLAPGWLGCFEKCVINQVMVPRVVLAGSLNKRILRNLCVLCPGAWLPYSKLQCVERAPIHPGGTGD